MPFLRIQLNQIQTNYVLSFASHDSMNFVLNRNRNIDNLFHYLYDRFELCRDRSDIHFVVITNPSEDDIVINEDSWISYIVY